MEKLVQYILRNKAFTWLILSLVFAGGIFAYVRMGKLEDAPFTIKQAVVTTAYPGASPMEVRSQVTDHLEEAIQSLGELYYLKSENRYGLSKITVYVKKEIRADDMQQLWDKLRRKVSDAQSKLPDGAGPSVVNDDFGDVLGVFYALKGPGYTNRQLADIARDLKNELLTVKDVAKVELFGVQSPTIDVLVSPALLSTTGLTMADIMEAFEYQNKVVDAGAVETDKNRLRIDAAGSFTSLDEIRNMTITSRGGEYFRLGDVAEISEGYLKPARNIMRVGNVPSIGIAISTVPDGNVVEMAEAAARTVSGFSETLPGGCEIVCIYDQGVESAVANNSFVLNLILSVFTVVVILLFFIGFRNGLLVGSGLVFSIFATLIYMWVTGIALQRMSLAAIIIAMGMLVDNAIVVTDSALVNMQRGLGKGASVLRAVTSTAIPLLAATVIAILTFMPIRLSPHITGELLSSLVSVIAVSLMFSWIFAITQTPFFIQEFVREPKGGDPEGNPFQGKGYDRFRNVLSWVIRRKYYVMGAVAVLLAVTMTGFRNIPQVFVPQLNKKYFTIDMWLPEGSRIEYADDAVKEVVAYLEDLDGVCNVSSFIGQTPPRYYLANTAYGPQPNYVNCLVEAESPEKSKELQEMLLRKGNALFPKLFFRVNRFELNTVPQAMIEARFCGKDPEILDSLTNVAIDIMRKNPKTSYVRNEWGNMAMKVNAPYDPVKAGRVGISKASVVTAAKSVGDGVQVGIYRDNEKKVPLMLKTAVPAEADLDALRDLPVWNGYNSSVLDQVTGNIAIGWEWPLVKTYNRELSMAAMCDVQPGCTMAEVRNEIAEEIEAIDLPEGYTFFWDSQYKDQKEGVQALVKYFPLAFLLLVVILVALFGNFRQPLIILLMLPLSVTGMIIGLLITGFDFGFFCMAGWLGLLGMIIKNIIVLMDEINIQRKNGVEPFEAVVEATVSRTRPVLMAALTTICGMLPLMFDVVFNGMATTIVFGLTVATVLTLVVTPALYSIFYKIR